MTIIDTILNRPEFADRPPVLLDIGAAGEIDRKWRNIAPYSVCIAFDADDREMGYVVRETSGYRKLYVYNCIVTDAVTGEADFHLTSSPQCSSLLDPRQESLDNWAFGDYFRVDRNVRLKTVALPDVLAELGIDKVDWFKTDSQGTDLRLFKSLGDERIRRVLAAEFEPGFIDAYQGEDKLWSLLAYMEGRPFWMTSLQVKGSQRISRNIGERRLNPLERRFLPALLKTSPGWGEVAYLNTFGGDPECLDMRDYLLGWVFAFIEEQYGFAMEIAARGYERFNDPLFPLLEAEALVRLRYGFLRVPAYLLTTIGRKLARRFAALRKGGE